MTALLCLIPQFLLTVMGLFTAAQMTVSQPIRGINVHRFGVYLRNGVKGPLTSFNRRQENLYRPSYIRRAQLLSKLGFHLGVLEDGTVQGVNQSYCRRTGRCKKRLRLACCLARHCV